MGRPAHIIVDSTPLTGRYVDVGSRVGWMLRTHRAVVGWSLQEMSRRLRGEGLKTSVATLSRVESGELRMGAIADAYEQALGLQSGQVRAAIDVLCRSFPNAPIDQQPDAHRSDELVPLTPPLIQCLAVSLAETTGSNLLEHTKGAEASACPQSSLLRS
jgi:hypothetical protein